MAATVLTDKTAIKAWLNITGSESDTLLDALALSVSRFIAEYLGRPLIGSNSYTTKFNGDGQQVLFMPNRPVTAVSAVSVDEVAISAASSSLTDGFVFDGTRVMLRGYSFSCGFQNVTITYTAGWDTTTDAIDAIKKAATMLASYLYKQRTRVGLTSEAMDNQTTAFITDIPKDVASILNPYKNVVPA